MKALAILGGLLFLNGPAFSAPVRPIYSLQTSYDSLVRRFDEMHRGAFDPDAAGRLLFDIAATRRFYLEKLAKAREINDAEPRTIETFERMVTELNRLDRRVQAWRRAALIISR